MPRLPGRVGPLGLALTAYDVWRRLPPTQRKLVMQQVRRYGPVVATQALQTGHALPWFARLWNSLTQGERFE